MSALRKTVTFAPAGVPASFGKMDKRAFYIRQRIEGFKKHEDATMEVRRCVREGTDEVQVSIELFFCKDGKGRTYHGSLNLSPGQRNALIHSLQNPIGGGQ